MEKEEMKVVKNSIIYEIRLLVDADDKENYTKDEILKLLDTVTRAKEPGEVMDGMNMVETARLILDLRAKGWNDTDIVNHILYIVTGEEKYKTKETADR